MKVAWTLRARVDALEHALHIAKDNPWAAADWLDEVVASAGGLARHPRKGRIVPEFDKEDIRELFVHSHRIVYRIKAKRIEVLRVWHAARLLKKKNLGTE